MGRDLIVFQAEMIDEDDLYNAQDICQYAHVSLEEVLLMIHEGMLNPLGNTLEDWQFSLQDAEHARLAKKLQDDLDINLAGAALVLELLK